MSNLVAVAPRVCLGCGSQFTPKAGGYNARYCADRCKRKAQRARLKATRPQAIKLRRARSYSQTKSHPDRLKRHRATARRYRQHGREWLAAYKLSVGCVDCGYREHAAALQLDHEGPKSVEIADARSSIRRLKAEIASGLCKERCANCHSIKTWKRKQVTRDHGSIGRGCE